MTRKQSRSTQRALERALFGPEPAPLRRRRQVRPHRPLDATPQIPGACAYCGNRCDLAWGTWTCPHCGVTYVAP